jgi:hypothetical protein
MGETRDVYRVLVGRLREGDLLEDPGIGGRIILKCMFEKWDGAMDYIDLTQDNNDWLVFVNAVMNLRVSLSERNFLTI